MKEIETVYSEDQGGYLLILGEGVIMDLQLRNPSGKSLQIFHRDKFALEVLAGEIRKALIVFRTTREGLLRRNRARKAIYILVLILALTGPFFNRQVAALLHIDLFVLNILITVVVVLTAIKYFIEWQAGERPVEREFDMYQVALLRKKILREYTTGSI